jgi:hypothetical protein
MSVVIFALCWHRREARKEIPENMAALKQRMEES